jgi:hypothetical protein
MRRQLLDIRAVAVPGTNSKRSDIAESCSKHFSSSTLKPSGFVLLRSFDEAEPQRSSVGSTLTRIFADAAL